LKTRIKIVSGGQTGVDRAVLDAALDANIDCGGWCPKGRLASDGIISDNYPLQALTNGGYRPRTLKNVLDSDATVIIYFDTPVTGTELTIEFCIKKNKPYLLIDAIEVSSSRAAERVQEFVEKARYEVINFAGPSADTNSTAYLYTYEAVMGFIKKSISSS